jgi:hypothetical protein
MFNQRSGVLKSVARGSEADVADASLYAVVALALPSTWIRLARVG